MWLVCSCRRSVLAYDLKLTQRIVGKQLMVRVGTDAHEVAPRKPVGAHYSDHRRSSRKGSGTV